MGRGSRWALLFTPWKSQNGDYCCLPPDRVKLTVNSKKETNSRVKMGQESRWASVTYPLKKSKCAAAVYPLTESNNWTARKKERVGSNWVKRSQVGPGPFWLEDNRVKLGLKESSWAWVKLGQAHFDSESNRAKESRWVGTFPYQIQIVCQGCNVAKKVVMQESIWSVTNPPG